MSLANRSVELRSRRWFLCAVPSALQTMAWAARGDAIPSAFARYLDTATELPVTRLTDAAYTSSLPAPYARILDRRGNFLIYSSDRSGRREAYRLDLKKGESRQLTDAENLGPISLLPSDNAFVYMDGSALMTSTLSSPRPREIYRAAASVEHLSVSIDGLYAALIEQSSPERLRLIDLRTGTATTLAEADRAQMSTPIPRPKRASVLYLRGSGEAWLANYDGKQNYRLRLAPGRTEHARWSPDGRSLFYLNIPAEEGKLRNLREFVPDMNEDRKIADTTQYDSFAVNADASVFAGISMSKASPYVFLLARKVNREFALCEHGGHGSAPVFSPNSQQVFFTSDMHGKAAIYRMDVEKLVEQTGDQP